MDPLVFAGGGVFWGETRFGQVGVIKKTFDWLAIHIPSLDSVFENKRFCLKNKTRESRILLPGFPIGFAL